MVEKYNARIRGVDLCYMLLALYRIRLRTCKYYMLHGNITAWASPLQMDGCYIRDISNKSTAQKKDQMDLCQFQSNVANALLGNKEKDTPRRGCPSSSSSSSTPNGPSPAKSVTLQHFLSLLKISDLIVLGTFPYSLKKKQNRCRFSPRGYSLIRCRK